MADDVNSTIRNPTPPRLVVGISGASGAIYGARVLDALRELGVESHLVVTKAALLTLSQETDLSPADLMSKADVTYRPVSYTHLGRRDHTRGRNQEASHGTISCSAPTAHNAP